MNAGGFAVYLQLHGVVCRFLDGKNDFAIVLEINGVVPLRIAYEQMQDGSTGVQAGFCCGGKTGGSWQRCEQR